MQLITESAESLQFLKESINGQKEYYIRGIFMQANIKNKNGRIYPLHILEKEVARYVREEINQDRACGELGHPQGPTINYDRVSHKIVSLEQEGTNFIGKALILDTEHGVQVKRLLDGKMKLAVSSRGIGTVKKIGDADRVQEDFVLATPADIVHNPSAPSAYVNGIMENVEWVCENGIWSTGTKTDENIILENFEDLLDQF